MNGEQLQNNLLSLGCLNRVTMHKGTPIPQINRNFLETLRQKATADGLRYTGVDGIDKHNKLSLPALYVYNGTKDYYTPSNICFIDIDTTIGVDDIINGSDKLFTSVSECCQVVAIQKSYSSKLHIIAHIPMCETLEQWQTEATWANLYILQEINRIFGYDYKVIPKTDANGNPEINPKTGKPKTAWDTGELTFNHALSVSTHEIIQPTYIESPDFIPYKYRKNQFADINKYTQNKKTEIVGIVRKGLGFEFWNVGYNGEKIRMNRDFYVNIGGVDYAGNELRWRIVPAIYSLFGDEYKTFINEYFVNSAELLACKKDYTPGKNFIKWLCDYFSITPHVPVLKTGEYLTKYGTNIRQYIADNPRAGLIAPTGAGKTTLIKEIAKEQNAVILCPYVTIVEQYKGITQLKTLRNGEKLDKRPYVATFDKALKFDLSERLVIIDESHALFLDTTYRDRLNYLLHDLRENKQQRILLVSATPCKEFDILGVRNPLTFRRERNTIPLHWEIIDGNPTIKETEIVNKFRRGNTNFDKLVIFDDFSAKLLYSQYPDESALLSTDTKQRKDFVFTMERKMLANRLTFSTKVCFNGVDFNDDGNILVICRFTPGVTLEQHITQCAGRFRNPSARITLLVLESPTIKKTSIEERIQLAQKVARLNQEYGELSALIQRGIVANRFNDTTIAEINKLVSVYETQESTRDNVLNRLRMRGYFDIKPIYSDKVGRKYDNKVKRQASDGIKKQLIDGIKPKDLKIDTRFHFAMNWKRQLVQLTEMQPTGKVLYTYKRVANYVETAKGKNIGAIIGDLQRMANTRDWTADDWNKYNEIHKIIFHAHKGNKRATTVIMSNYKKYLSAFVETHQGEQTAIDWGNIDFGKPAKPIGAVLKDRATEKRKYQRNQRKKVARRLQLICRSDNRKRIFATTRDAEIYLMNNGYNEKSIRFLLKNGKDGNYNIKKIVAI